MSTDTNLAKEVETLKQQLALIVRSIRTTLVLILLTLGAVSFQKAAAIPKMAAILRDMVSPESQPWFTQWVMGHQEIFIAFPVVAVGFGLGALAIYREPGKGILTATIVAIILLLEWQVVISATQGPLTEMLSNLGSGPVL